MDTDTDSDSDTDSDTDLDREPELNSSVRTGSRGQDLNVVAIEMRIIIT